MSGFSKDSFVGKLSKLNDQASSIQTLSHWVQYHKKSCVESAEVWASEALRAPPARQLLFVYLANDIMQNSRRKGPEFVKAYGAQLLIAFPRILAAASEAVQAKLLRMVGIWEDRQVLSSSTLAELRSRIGAGGGLPALSQVHALPSSSKPPASSRSSVEDFSLRGS